MVLAFDPMKYLPLELGALAVGLVVFLLALGIGWWFSREKKQAPAKDVTPSQDPEIEFLRGITLDRRTSPRRKGNSVEIQLVIPPSTQPIQGWIIDRSIGGLRVLLDREVPSGLIVQVRPGTNHTKLPWVDTTVKSCRLEGTYFDVGLQFVQTPNLNVMMQFG